MLGCQQKATTPFCVSHTKRGGKIVSCKNAELGLHNGSKNHRAIERRGYIGRKLYLTQAEGLAHLHSGDIAGYAAGDVLNGALHGNLVHDLVYNTTHAHANRGTGKLNGNLGLHNRIRRYSLKIKVHSGVSKEATLYILNHGKHLCAVQVKFYQHAVGISSVEESTNVRNLSLYVDVALYGRAVYNAGYITLGAKSIEFTCAANLTLGDVECKSRHNDDMMYEIVVCLSSSDVGARLLSPAGLVSPLPQGRSGRRECHFC